MRKATTDNNDITIKDESEYVHNYKGVCLSFDTHVKIDNNSELYY